MEGSAGSDDDDVGGSGGGHVVATPGSGLGSVLSFFCIITN